jgi:hypothetical protein
VAFHLTPISQVHLQTVILIAVSGNNNSDANFFVAIDSNHVADAVYVDVDGSSAGEDFPSQNRIVGRLYPEKFLRDLRIRQRTGA